MNAYEMVLGIVIITVAGGVLRSYLRRPSTAAAADGGQEQRLARLEERVRALEAVVTDHGYDLRKQFKELEH